MADYFRILDLTSTRDVFNLESEEDQALLCHLLELVRVLYEKNCFPEDYPVEVTLTITRVPRVSGAKLCKKEE